MQAFGGAISHLSEVPAHLLEEKYGILPAEPPHHPPVIDPRRVPTGGSGSTGVVVVLSSLSHGVAITFITPVS